MQGVKHRLAWVSRRIGSCQLICKNNRLVGVWEVLAGTHTYIIIEILNTEINFTAFSLNST